MTYETLTGSADLNLEISRKYRVRAEALIPGMTHTFGKHPINFCEGSYPIYVDRADGAFVWDVDGNQYLDFIGALGAAPFGYADPTTAAAIARQLERGILLSLPTPLEVTAAEALIESVPGIDMARFLKTGAEACAAALKHARARTGRDRAVLAGFHGWHDQLNPVERGVPKVVQQLTDRVSINNESEDALLIQLVRSTGTNLAAVMLSTPYHRVLSKDFLSQLREACSRTGCLLILDEIVTGFRLAPGGLGQLLGVTADMVCFSKSLGAGLPLAAVTGRRDVMADFDETGVSTTFGAELLSLAALTAAMSEFSKPAFYANLVTLGRAFRVGVNAGASKLGWSRPAVVGYDPMPCLSFFSEDSAEDTHWRRSLLGLVAQRGVLLRRDVNFISAAHTMADIEFAVGAVNDSLAILREGMTVAP